MAVLCLMSYSMVEIYCMHGRESIAVGAKLLITVFQYFKYLWIIR